MASLLDEFEIHPISGTLFNLGGHPVAFTNAALFMLLSVLSVVLLMVTTTRARAVVPGRWQMTAERVYDLVSDMVDSSAGEKGRAFFPLIFSIFTFVLFANLLGLLPGSLSVTSHIIVNLALATVLFTAIIVIGLIRQGTHFFSIFVPSGVHWGLLLFLVPIEIISFLVRPFSLSIRLFANMMAGHILLGVFASMAVSLLAAGAFLKPVSVLPLALNIAITGFEFFAALLQAYIYAILSAVYVRDAVESH